MPNPLISAGQKELAARGSLAPIVLVHLTTYTNYTAATVESEWWWTKNHPVLYPWAGGAAKEFDDAIRLLSPIVRRMEHLPNAQVADTRRTVLDMTLANDRDGKGDSLWRRLRTKNLHLARVEVALLLVDPARLLDVSPTAKRWDLRDLPGTEHVFHFRGELTGIGTVTETEIPLTFEAIEPNLAWPVCTVAAECDPSHLGKRYPIPVGRARGVPVINRKIGWVTTLAQEIASPTVTGNHLVTDATGLSGAGIELQIGAERVIASFVNATTINITARGQHGTQAIAHNASETIIEILASNVLVFSGIEAKELDALYVISPLSGEKVLIPTAAYSKTLADITTDPGRTISTVSFSATQFRTMIDSMAAVSQQPTLTGTASTDSLLFQSFQVESNFPETDNVDASVNVSPNRLAFVPLTGIDQGGKCFWTSNAGFPNPNAQVSAFRMTLGLQGLGGPGGFPNSQPTVLRYKITNLYGKTDIGTAYIFDNGVSEFGITFSTGWMNPVGGPYTESSGIVDASGNVRFVQFWIEEGGPPSGGFWDNTHNIAEVMIDSCRIEVQLEPASLTDLGIAALSLGWGLSFVADVQGAHTAGVLHEKMPDILEWFIGTFAGLGASAIDGPSFTQAKLDLGSNVHAGVLNLAGETFGEILARLSYEGRCNFVVRETTLGTVYRCLAAESDYGFAASVRTLSEIKDQTETGRAAGERATRFRGFYDLDLDPESRSINEDDLKSVVRIDAEQNDASAKLATPLLTAAEALLGRRDALPIAFYFIRDVATAIDVLAYYAHEALRTGSRHAGSVPWDAGYDLELGDMVTLTPRDAIAPLKGRVTQTAILLDEARIGLNLEEVE
jgi:hypothetical protein